MNSTMNTLERTVQPPRAAHPRSLSPTALRTFDGCPRHYRFAYMERPAVEEQPASHLVAGNAVHQALAFLYRLPPKERSEKILESALRHHWARAEGRTKAFSDQEEEATWGRQALEQLARYYGDYRAEVESLEAVAVEEWLRTTLPNGLRIGGRADRIDRFAETSMRPASLRVVDYKTGTCRIEAGEELADDRGAQVYALAATRVYKQPVVEVRFQFLGEGRALTWKLEREDLALIEERLVEATSAIHATEEFEARPDFHCRWCAYLNLCPPGRGEARVDELDEQADTPF